MYNENIMGSFQEEGHVKLIIIAVLICLVTCFGLISNIIGICTIWKIPKTCKLFNHMVICLLVFDCWFLTASPLFFFGLQHEYFSCKLCAWLLSYWAVPCGYMAVFGTILMTLAISHERYLVIRNPFHYNQALLSDRAQKKRLLIYLVPALTISIIFSIPRFFVFEIRTNSTTNAITIPLTNLGCDQDYLLYYEFLASTILFGVIPFVLLTFMCYKTLKKLRSHNTELRLAGINNENSSHVRRQQEEQMAKVMVGLVVEFLILHFVRIFLNIYSGIMERCNRCDNKEITWLLDSYGIVVHLSVLMVMVNASIDTITYCAINSEFRRQLFCNLKGILKWRTIFKKTSV